MPKCPDVLASLLTTAALFASGCGDDGGAGTGSGTDTDPTTTDTPTTGMQTTADTTGGTTTQETDTSPTSTTDEPTGTGTDTGDEPADAFRFTDMFVRDPHFFVNVITCMDATDNVLIGDSINEQFNKAIDGDMSPEGMPDGLLDLSFVLLFRPMVDPEAAAGDVDLAVGDCTAPAESTMCTRKPMSSLTMATYTNMDSECLAPVMDELSSANYNPKPAATPGPGCFLATADMMLLDLGDFSLPLQDVQIAGQYMGDPTDQLVSGLLRGFLTEAAADATVLPMDIAMVGGKPISELLPGGTGNCANHDDRDDNNGTSGWWMYVNYTAVKVPWD